ncbi:MAG: hypothetical protein AB8G05_12925 [Oligoflexales bacterium]
MGSKRGRGWMTILSTIRYHQRLAGTSIPILIMAFNHSSQFQTLSYLGIEDEELTDAFLNVI